MVESSWVVLSSAVSGQAAMHAMHCVQFSAMNTGVARRATYFDWVAPVAEAMTPTEASAEAGWS